MTTDDQTRAWLASILGPLQDELRETEAEYAVVLKRAEGRRLAIKGLAWMLEAESLAAERD